jgi:hypothetical protein
MAIDLATMESNIIQDVMNVTSSMESLELQDEVIQAKEVVETVNDELTSSIATTLLSANNAERGLIVWLKPSAMSTTIRPMLLNLKETLQFLLTSEGSHSYDIFDKSDQFQFEFIENLMLRNQLDDVPAEKSIDMESIKEAKEKWFPHTGKKKTDIIDYSSTKDITATSNKIFDDLRSRVINISDKDGKL